MQSTQTPAPATPAIIIVRCTKHELVATVSSSSRPDKAHTVRLDLHTRQTRCTCEAGQHGRTCYHATAVLGAADDLHLIQPRQTRREARAVIDDFNPFECFGPIREQPEPTYADNGHDADVIGYCLPSDERFAEEQEWFEAYQAEQGYQYIAKSTGVAL